MLWIKVPNCLESSSSNAKGYSLYYLEILTEKIWTLLFMATAKHFPSKKRDYTDPSTLISYTTLRVLESSNNNLPELGTTSSSLRYVVPTKMMFCTGSCCPRWMQLPISVLFSFRRCWTLKVALSTRATILTAGWDSSTNARFGSSKSTTTLS